MQQFKQYWIQFSASLNLEKKFSDRLFHLLSEAYVESQRHYHTTQHIVECLDLFYQVKKQLNDPISVELAIWFHDVVYNPQAFDNEKQSAILMKQHCIEVLDSGRLDKIYEWIVATKNHQSSGDQDLNYLLDIDLAILGSSKQRFAEYEQQIQQEYSWVEPALYEVKRAEVLQHFYQMKPLYQTEYFRNLLEVNAKLNLLNS